MDSKADSQTAGRTIPAFDDPMLAAIQSILLAQERERLRQIEQQTNLDRQEAQDKLTFLQEHLEKLEAELAQTRQIANKQAYLLRDLEGEIAQLRRKSQADSEGLVHRLEPLFGGLVGRKIRESRDEMAEALGPVMGEAIRVQIRDSRQDMVEALYPVIGETVQRAISEFAREFQRNIDAQLKSTFGPEGTLRLFLARLRGVSPAALTMRNAFPFAVQEIFLIQRDSGLVIAQLGKSGDSDSDLIGGMLTAIRDFARDSFGQMAKGQELNEIQYGNDLRILIEGSLVVYVAVVFNGVEPAGFRAYLHHWLAELLVKYGDKLRHYGGDPAGMPDLQSPIEQLAGRYVAHPLPPPKGLSPTYRRVVFGGGVAFILFSIIACFYLQFTLALMPIAFPKPTATPTVIVAPTLTPTKTPTRPFTATAPPTATMTYSPTATPTASLPPSLTPTPSRTATPTITPTPSLTPTRPAALTVGHVWVRREPVLNSVLFAVIPAGTPVKVLAVYSYWVYIEWLAEGDVQQGWVPLEWVQFNVPIPAYLITPTPNS